MPVPNFKIRLCVVFEIEQPGQCAGHYLSILCLRSVLFWDVTQHWLLVSYRRFGTWHRYVVPKRRQLTTDQLCVISQKNDPLIDTTAEAWHHAHLVFILRPINSVKTARDIKLRTNALQPEERYRNKDSKKERDNAKTKKAGNRLEQGQWQTTFITWKAKILKLWMFPGTARSST